jgi:hypothetical protein
VRDEKKRELLRTYFAPKPKPGKAIGLVLLGVFGILFYLLDNSLGFCGGIGFLMAIIGGIWLFVMYSRRGNEPSDAQVDEWFKEDITEITEKALERVGLDESQLVRAPIPVTGPILWETNGVPSDDLLWKKGEDGIIRFAVNRVTIVFLSKIVLAAYACDFNFLKDVTLNETTKEYHYNDIVSVSTQEDSTSYTLPTGVSLVHSQAFRLSVASGESIKVTISAGKLSEITGGKIPTTSAEKAVQVIRTILRGKKG